MRVGGFDADDDFVAAAVAQRLDDLGGEPVAVTELRNLNLAWVTADPMPYVSSPYVCFRNSAARSRSLPAEAVTRLLNDDESIVRTSMARHAPHLIDPATAERIDRDYRPDKKTKWRPADDFTFSPQTLRRFATDPDPRMRCLAPPKPRPPSRAGRADGRRPRKLRAPGRRCSSAPADTLADHLAGGPIRMGRPSSCQSAIPCRDRHGAPPHPCQAAGTRCRRRCADKAKRLCCPDRTPKNATPHHHQPTPDRRYCRRHPAPYSFRMQIPTQILLRLLDFIAAQGVVRRPDLGIRPMPG